MANILDYLDWRGDVPFSVDPFNEVDNLVFAQAAYVLLDGILDEEGRISPADAAEAFFERFTREEVERDHIRHKDAPFLLEKMAKATRYQGLEVAHYINRIDEEAEAQISATSFVLPSFTYVSFRGTDDSLVGWKEDFKLSFLPETKGQRMAVEYLNRHYKNSNERLFVGGHSKGGNFAVYASAFCESVIRDRIERVFSNDGPGFRKEVTRTDEYDRVIKKVDSILPESTLVGTLFNGRYTHKIIKSSALGLHQHDATTWEVQGNHFIEAPSRSEDSFWMDDVLSNWLAKLSDEDRVFFTDMLFDMLTGTGATTLEDLSDGGISGLAEMARNMRSLPKEQRKEFSRIIGELVRSFRTEMSKSYMRDYGETVG